MQAGHSVRLFDRPHVDLSNIEPFQRSVEIFFGDMTNQVDLEESLAGIDTVLHFASATLPQSSTENVRYDLDANVGGFLSLLEAMKKRKVTSMIYSSSGGTVYGLLNKLPVEEEHSTDPISAYGVSKVAIEKYMGLYHHLYGINSIILRSSNPYGPRQNLSNPQGVITHSLAAILEGRPIEIWGDGSVVRDYFFVGDLLPLFPKLLTSKVKHGIFNVGSGKGHSLKQILTAIGRTLNVKPAVRYLPARPLDVPKNVLKVKKIQKSFGWKSSTNLDTGIKMTWEWLRSGARRKS